jgi:hypothetical protein
VRHGRSEYQHDLAIGAVFKDEAANLDEWLHFHSGVGVTHFYLYSNNSSDNYLEVLSPWLAEGRVTLIDWPRGNQRGAYTHCIRKVRAQCRWIAFIDLDEFLYSPSDRYLPDALRDYQGCAAIFVYWILFGSSGHETRPQGYVLDAYTQCLDATEAARDQFDHLYDNTPKNYVTGWAKDGKSIVDPRKVRTMNPHRPRTLFTGDILDENLQPPLTRCEDSSLSFERFRINHYWAKSTQELTQKLHRGRIANPRHPPKNLDRWLERSQCLNGSEDQDIQEVWGKIKNDRGL